MAIIWFNWWKFLHLFGLVAFLACHGVSMFVLYRIRSVAPDRAKITELISFSGTTTLPMYVSLLVLVAGGVGAGLTIDAFGQLWLWVAIAILVVTIALMTAMAAPYFTRITEACEVRPSGVPRKSDEELEAILHGSATLKITLIGAVGLLSILYLMIFKPWL
jgi:hypothetical protein